jgi:hypothetical protein
MNPPAKIEAIPKLPERERILAETKRHNAHSDALYVGGALLVSLGIGMIRIRYGVIAAGVLALIPPMLELASGFLKGLRQSGARVSQPGQGSRQWA